VRFIILGLLLLSVFSVLCWRLPLIPVLICITMSLQNFHMSMTNFPHQQQQHRISLYRLFVNSSTLSAAEKSGYKVYCTDEDIITPPLIGEHSIVMSMSVCLYECVCVCLSAIISSELHVRFSPIFCECYLQPWLAPTLAV